MFHIRGRAFRLKTSSRLNSLLPCRYLTCGPSGLAASAGSIQSRERIVFSGIQPTGIPHLGNYLGALQPWVRLQDNADAEATLLFSIVDLHSLTSRTMTPSQRRESKRQMLATFLAIGLDPDRSILFHQSDVPYHAELHWILSCDASMGFLSRMRQWQSKLGDEGAAALLQPSQNPKSEQRMKLGLFSYPVLQAADILLYRTTHVPVGEDQVQHIEFARNLATAFNAAYGGGGKLGTDGRKQKGKQILVPPTVMVSPAKRVMSLSEPTKKMSKSDENVKSRISILDEEDVIRKKIGSAVTDSIAGVSYDPTARPGVSNLIEIIANLDGSSRLPSEIANEFASMAPLEGSVLKLLKQRCSDVIIDHLTPIRQRYQDILANRDSSHLDILAHEWAAKAEALARPTIEEVKVATGLK